jgi:hypothetical protein
MKDKSDTELLQIVANGIHELARRGIIRSASWIGDYAELLVTKHYQGTRNTGSGKGWDVQTPTERIQVKAQWQSGIGNGAKPRYQIGGISSKEYPVVAILFDQDLKVQNAWYIPTSLIERFGQSVGSRWRILLTKEFLTSPEL